MKKYVIKLFRCGSLKQITAQIIHARNLDAAYKYAQAHYKPDRHHFVGAMRVRI